MDNETIDVTEWLHQSFHKVYSFRFKRGDIIIHNDRYHASTQFAFDELYRLPENQPIMNASQLSAAEFITTLREVAFTRTGYGRLTELMRHIHRQERLEGYCPMTLYSLIMKGVTKQHSAMVERICWQPLKTNDWGWINQCAQNIKDSFDDLSASIEKSIDILRKRLEDSNMKKGQLCPEFKPVS